MSVNLLPIFSRYSPQEIIKLPDKRLRKSCKQVKTFKIKTREIVRKLIQITKKVDSRFNPFLGMAAPQIGYNQQIILIKKKYKNYLILVNPKVIEKKWHLVSLSTCYSLKGLYLLKRYFWYKLSYQDIRGNFHQTIIKGGIASVLQQELEHLQGKLICD